MLLSIFPEATVLSTQYIRSMQKKICIRITLPEPKIICDGVDNDSVTTKTETSFLSNVVNPVESDEVTNHLQEIEKKN